MTIGVKLRIEVLFKKFHPRIHLTTLFFTKLYLLNTLEPFSGHEYLFLGPKPAKPRKTSLRNPLGTWKTLNNYLKSAYRVLLLYPIFLGTAASGPDGHFLRLINSGDLKNINSTKKPGRSLFLPSLKSKIRIV
jgi:hypothetical protein